MNKDISELKRETEKIKQENDIITNELIKQSGKMQILIERYAEKS